MNPGLGGSPGGGLCNPLQYTCLENPHGQRSLAGYSPWGHKVSDTTEQLGHSTHLLCDPWASLVAQMVKNLPVIQETWVHSIPGLGRSPGRGHGTPLQYSCLENPHGQRSLGGPSPWGRKELDMTEQLSTAHRSPGSGFLNNCCQDVGQGCSLNRSHYEGRGLLYSLT